MTTEDQEGRAAARNREFLGVQTGRAITDSDLDKIENGAATVAYSTVLGGLRDPDQDIGAVALMFGVKHWRASKRTEALWWPLAEEGSDAFRFNILWQMSVVDPAGPYPQLRKLPIERARPPGMPAGDLVSMAFNAGLATGALGTASKQDVARGGGASRSRVTEMLLSYTQDRKDAAEERRDLLLSFARAKIEADPHISTAEIARAFRAEHRPAAGERTDLEDNEIRAWRKPDGQLKPRVLRKAARDS